VSNLVYPTLPGLAWPVERTSNWGTRMQRAVSGRTLRLKDYVNPIWNWTLTYTLLEDNPALGGGVAQTLQPNALRILLDFFNSRAGAADDFLFADPNDNAALAQVAIPVPGDQTGTLFQLTRALVAGGFQEWIIAPNVVSAVYFNGSPQSPASYQVISGGVLKFNNAVGGGITVTADLTYYFRVYFADRMNPSYFAQRLAELKQVRLTSEVD
jgi:hypothetical protein